MQLARASVAVPLLKISVRIEHATPRRPTAFERVMLSAVTRLGEHREYRTWPLDRVFREMLMVPSGGALIKEALRELEAVGVLAPQPGCGLSEDSILGEVLLTERGREMVELGLLPARAQVDDAVLYYDPIKCCFVPRREFAGARSGAVAVAVPVTNFLKFVPRQLLCENISDMGFEWYRENAKVVEVIHAETEVAWKTIAGIVAMRNGQVFFDGVDAEYAEFVNALGEEFMMAEVLGGCLVEAAAGVDRGTAPLERLQPHPEGIVYWVSKQSIRESIGSTGRVWLVDGRTISWALGPENLDNCTVVLFNDRDAVSGPTAHWNSRRTGCVVRTSDPYPLRNTLLASNDRLFHEEEFTIRVGERRWNVPLAEVIPMEKPRRDVREAVTDLATKMYEYSVEGHAIWPALASSSEEFWEVTVQAIVRQHLSLKESLRRLFDVRAEASKCKNVGPDDSWCKAVKQLVESQIDAGSRMPLRDAKAILEKLKAMPSLGNAVRSAATAMITKTVSAAETLEEFEMLQQFMHAELGEDAGQDSVHWYSTPLYKEIADRYGDPALASIRDDIEGFGHGYRELHMAAARVKSIDALVADSNAARAWLEQVNTVLHRYPAFAAAAVGTRLSSDVVRVLRAVIDAKHGTSPLALHNRTLMVMDPRAVMSTPAVLDAVRPEQTLLVPIDALNQIATAELNGASMRAREDAILALSARNPNQLFYCDAGFLADESVRQGRQPVIALARAFRHVAVLVSDNAYFGEIAAEHGVLMWTVADFMMRNGNANGHSARSPRPKLRSGNEIDRPVRERK